MRLVYIHGLRDQFPIQRMCAVMGVSTSGYYTWRDRPLSKRSIENQKLLTEIRIIHEESRQTYGSPRIHAKLGDKGFIASRNRVARLMRAENIHSKRKRRRVITTNSQHAYPIAPNLLHRDFEATKPNQKWLGDITYIPTEEGFLYLAAVLDLFSRKIVGWAMEDTMESCLVEQAFSMAVLNRKQVEGLLHHTDRGSQYASGSYQKLLTTHHIQVSMSRGGDCFDNAPMESFFSTLKCEQVHLQYYRTRLEARTDIFAYIESFYNRTRLHSSLGYLSPDEFERWYYNNLS